MNLNTSTYVLRSKDRKCIHGYFETEDKAKIMVKALNLVYNTTRDAYTCDKYITTGKKDLISRLDSCEETVGIALW